MAKKRVRLAQKWPFRFSLRLSALAEAVGRRVGRRLIAVTII